MNSEYQTLAEETRISLKREGSKFIGIGIPVEGEEEFQSAKSRLQEEFSDATHICYGLILITGNSLLQRYDADGEPSGTAGKPILSILEGFPLRNVVVFVIRYFGGIELGTGGLVRAYSDATRQVLNAGTIKTSRRRLAVVIDYPYRFTGKVMEVIEGLDAEVESREYGESASIEISLPTSSYDYLKEKIAGATSGRAVISEVST